MSLYQLHHWIYQVTISMIVIMITCKKYVRVIIDYTYLFG